jgi:hypothetical protein
MPPKRPTCSEAVAVFDAIRMKIDPPAEREETMNALRVEMSLWAIAGVRPSAFAFHRTEGLTPGRNRRPKA